MSPSTIPIAFTSPDEKPSAFIAALHPRPILVRAHLALGGSAARVKSHPCTTAPLRSTSVRLASVKSTHDSVAWSKVACVRLHPAKEHGLSNFIRLKSSPEKSSPEKLVEPAWYLSKNSREDMPLLPM